MVDNSMGQKVVHKQISISCSADLQKVLSSWIQDFKQEYPNIQLTFQDTNSDFLLTFQDRALEIEAEETWRIPVMREGIIPVISDQNPYMDKLEYQGIDKDMLIRIFTTNQISWGDILRNDAKEKVSVFLPDEAMSCNKKWADFLGIDAELMQAKRFSDKKMLYDFISQDPYSIAVVNACCAYNPETNESIEGIKALSIDLNDNGHIDSKEEISDNLCDLERAFYLGLLPSKLCNCIFLQAEQKPTNKEQIIFIKWILTVGQKHVADHGFSIIRNSMAVKLIQDLENLTSSSATASSAAI
jgi:phosphate transport system substrate-binding protein